MKKTDYERPSLTNRMKRHVKVYSNHVREKIYFHIGSPTGVLTDQGRDFLSNLLKRLAKRFRIKQFRTTAFHPQSNGSLERSHHILDEYLK